VICVVSLTFSFIVKAPKKNPGERFEGLEMLTELLRPQGASSVAESSKIEILSEENLEEVVAAEEEEEEEWYYEQEMPKDEDTTISLGSNKAGKF
jgi:hypothetical protein